MGIRRYFVSKDGSLRPRKEDGVSLNYEEIQKLLHFATHITMYLAESLSNTRVIKVTNEDDIGALTLYVSNFLQFNEGADYDGKLRLILEK